MNWSLGNVALLAGLCLIGAGALLFIIGLAMGVSDSASVGTDSQRGIGLTVTGFLLGPIGIVIAIVGLLLRRGDRKAFERAFIEAQSYAELHGWHVISRVSWQSVKPGGDSLSVAQTVRRDSFLASLNIGGTTHAIDGFERPLWALQFADWLWAEVSQRPEPAEEVVREVKQALVLRRQSGGSSGPEPSTTFRPSQFRGDA